MVPTVFVDIDGTLLPHTLPISKQHADKEFHKKALEGAVEKMQEWDSKGYHIILTTGRRECWREWTKEQLRDMGISYDHLLMGIGTGPRYIINDLKPGRPDEPMAVAINLTRNEGIGKLQI